MSDIFSNIRTLAEQVRALWDRQAEEREAAGRQAEQERQATNIRLQNLFFRLEGLIPDIVSASGNAIRYLPLIEEAAGRKRLFVTIGETLYEVGPIPPAAWQVGELRFESDQEFLGFVMSSAVTALREILEVPERYPCPHCLRVLDSRLARARHVCRAHSTEDTYRHIDPFALNEKGQFANDLTPWLEAVEALCASK